MREDFLEKLDTMFPDGYVIVYTNPDKSKRVSLFNPNNDNDLYGYHQAILDFSDKG